MSFFSWCWKVSFVDVGWCWTVPFVGAGECHLLMLVGAGQCHKLVLDSAISAAGKCINMSRTKPVLTPCPDSKHDWFDLL